MVLSYIVVSVISVISYVIVSKIVGYIRKSRRKKTQSTPTISIAIDPFFKDEIQDACRELHEKFGIKETMREFALRALYRELLKFEASQESVEEAKQYIQQRELDKYNRYYRNVNERQRREYLKQEFYNQSKEYHVGGNEASDNRSTRITPSEN